jgi:hypothetical protein
MRNKQTQVREYKITDTEFYFQAKNFIGSAERDQEQFAGRGYPPARIEALNMLCTDFMEIRSDDEMLGAIVVATDKRDTVAEELRVHLRSIRTMAANALGPRSARYRAFGLEKMDGLRDELLYFLGRRVMREATANRDILADEGLTEAKLQAIGQTMERLLLAIDARQLAEKARDLQTEKRLEAGNTLYREIVRLCNTGKDLFVSTDEARYNDYVIYNTPAIKKPKEVEKDGGNGGNAVT